MKWFWCKTRDGRRAQVWREEPLPWPFIFAGRIENRDYEVWTGEGHWRADGVEHPSDIIDLPPEAKTAKARVAEETIGGKTMSRGAALSFFCPQSLVVEDTSDHNGQGLPAS